MRERRVHVQRSRDFLEYAMDVADACRDVGVQSVAVTAGYMHDAPRRAFYEKIDAANVDLKAFTEDFYWKTTGGHLEPVKDTLRYLVRETNVWTEITTLIIPGHNDSDAELTALAEFVCGELGPEVPLHFPRFTPTTRCSTSRARRPRRSRVRARSQNAQGSRTCTRATSTIARATRRAARRAIAFSSNAIGTSSSPTISPRTRVARRARRSSPAASPHARRNLSAAAASAFDSPRVDQDLSDRPVFLIRASNVSVDVFNASRIGADEVSVLRVRAGRWSVASLRRPPRVCASMAESARRQPRCAGRER